MIGDKKILVTGCKGMLGSSIIMELNEFSIIGFGRELDVTCPESVVNFLSAENPDIIIHTAAYTNVEEGENLIDKSYLINTLGTQNLVNYCANKNILFVFISSTGVYGEAKNKRYTEFDEVKPTTVHHKSKYLAEDIVKNHCNKFLIIRTCWLYGGDKTFKKNFVYNRFLEAKQKSVIFSDNSQIGNPTYVKDLVEQIKVLIQSGQYGVFNCVNTAEGISRFDYVKKIIQFFNLNVEVKVAPKGMFERRAKVSKNESAQNYKLELLGLNIMRPWEEPLKEYIETLID